MNELEMGIEVELEHRDLIIEMLEAAGKETSEENIRAIAAEIAKVHIEEDKEYYTKLKQIEKEMPSRSSVHVDAPLEIEKENCDDPPLNNIGKAAGDNEEYNALYDMQQIIEGMDWEMRHSTKDPQTAKDTAIEMLMDDPYYYKKLKLVPKEDYVDNNGSGFYVDLGSNVSREDGHLGFDLYPYDYGTIVHDLNDGIPLSDGSVKKIRAVDSLHHISDDPKAMLSEIHRVLMPGGQFEYQGPEEIYNYPEWHHEFPGLVMVNHEDNVQKIEGNPTFRQVFTRLAVPDAATANDAEPRTGVAQYDMLPADALLAMDALGYFWSDATSSGKGNRLHGYPSQGALVGKGGPGSGPHEGGGKGSISGAENLATNLEIHNQKIAPKENEVKEAKQKLISAQRAAENAPEHEKEKKMSLYNQAKKYFNDKKDEYHSAIKDHIDSLKTMDNPNSVFVKSKVVKIAKADKMRQIVYGVVLAPDEVDFQDDFMVAPDIEEAAHQYLVRSRTVGKQHEDKMSAEVVESYIAPQDLQFDGQNGPQEVKKGSWVVAIKINDPHEWEKVLNGEYTGFSVGGHGERE
jgi:SAM-dependent methyltransferase